jgi:hypothetical protein
MPAEGKDNKVGARGEPKMHVCRREEGAYLGTLVEIRSIDVVAGDTEVCDDSDGQDVV